MTTTSKKNQYKFDGRINKYTRKNVKASCKQDMYFERPHLKLISTVLSSRVRTVELFRNGNALKL